MCEAGFSICSTAPCASECRVFVDAHGACKLSSRRIRKQERAVCMCVLVTERDMLRGETVLLCIVELHLVQSE